ncbi:PQQ-dependent sugar dehydrogenase [Gammaproteobacteria bacterium AS21]|jgi:glucose/arabinose dehydrogenase
MKALNYKYLLALVTVALMASSSVYSTAQSRAFNDIKAIEHIKLAGVPWGMTFVSDEQLVVTLKEGSAWLLNTINGETREILGLAEVAVSGQGGLLDVAVSPNYDQDQWLYFTYATRVKAGATTALGRAKLVINNEKGPLQLTNWQSLLVTDAGSHKGQHFGSRIAFDNSGHVFFGVGDRGDRENAQDLRNHAGKIIRLNLDGSIPADNPFVTNDKALAHIWSYGHRNPQGLVFDSKTKQLWSAEHGPRGGDEINLIEKGKNYGWPVVSFGKEYWGPIDIGEGTEKAGMQAPSYVYIPSIAPSFLLINNDQFFLGALVKQHLNVVSIDGMGKLSERRYLESLSQRVRSMAINSQGESFIATDSGVVYRLKYIP